MDKSLSLVQQILARFLKLATAERDYVIARLQAMRDEPQTKEKP